MTFERNYSSLDRWVHWLAFSGRAVQQTAEDMEGMLFAKHFRDIEVRRPVFVTSLPRAGTTLLLDVINQSPAFATHSYRDMPFVFAPILWQALSGGFQKRAELAERAHGDGMKVGYDSPEAFEEVLWKGAWPQKFVNGGIELWSDDESAPAFETSFANHMRKIIALRAPAGAEKSVRYVSKNNANVARLGYLRRLFADADILIPFRDPFAQAGSLLNQHTRFLEVHQNESFSRRYMEDIGHLEFGALHRPILFPKMAEVIERYKPEQRDYWVAYWVAAFEHVLSHDAGAKLVSYERACVDRQKTLAALAAALGIPEESFAAVPADLFHAPRAPTEPPTTADPALAARAHELHEACLARSIV